MCGRRYILYRFFGESEPVEKWRENQTNFFTRFLNIFCFLHAINTLTIYKLYVHIFGKKKSFNFNENFREMLMILSTACK